MEASQVQEFWQKVALQHPEMADFLCPLTGQLMKDPVTAPDGFNYESAQIRQWLEKQKVSPQTARPMAADLRPNDKLRTAIEKFLILCGASSPTFPVDLLWDAHGLRAEYKTTRVLPGYSQRAHWPLIEGYASNTTNMQNKPDIF
eukprot:s1119_g6.t1